MVSKKARIVIIGAGMAGLTAANKLYTSGNQDFELSVVEGGTRIGGRVNSSEFCGDRIEQGATWIHGIEGSPVHKIAQHTNSLQAHQPWECMDGIPEDPVTIAEGGHELHPSLVDPISTLFKNLMDFIQGHEIDDNGFVSEIVKRCELRDEKNNVSVGSFLRQGLQAYWSVVKDDESGGFKGVGKWKKKALEEAIFAMNESIQRTFTSADDLCSLDYNAESEYVMFPGEEITIARGYSSVVEYLASVLPMGMIQLGRKVEKIEWRIGSDGPGGVHVENGYDYDNSPVKLHFSDGAILAADHVIVTVSLGVLKKGISDGFSMFTPPLPSSKTGAISRLGYGVVNKVFLRRNPDNTEKFPLLQMVFHPQDSELRHPNIPNWMRKTSFLTPIYTTSRVVLSWFTGQEALEIESLTDEEIANGFTSTVSNLLSKPETTQNSCNGSGNQVKFDKVLRTRWGTNPLFMGSYSYVAVGSSIDDMDTLAEPLPGNSHLDTSIPPLQILFAGEATHRTHYSTTHGAYFSGLREANRLLKHYNNYIGV
ncbi:hypothetical protein BUALT_Bualt16G0052200 [Buddleja alternifolia]|uniref:Amine oxidase domain-containing protein n=1 Tax=Buddleja alternifolia TaxID=168488 RepID=A0AAV6WFU2_9LAMI|nr:hypothetical protein BUALT_Bualt16G0052200 [Buddleja alternifolia]